MNQCKMEDGEKGYCGLRENRDGIIVNGGPESGKVSWYYDSLPTNCVGDWICPGGTGAGYPEFAHCDGPEYGFKNLAVFYHACTFDCLFCQNWQYRELTGKSKYVPSHLIADAVDKQTSCICFFGGDPTPQLPHAISASKLAKKKKKDHILRICWETNGSMNRSLLKEMVDISIPSGGCIKFDLKAWDEGLHLALCGVSNQRTIENFKYLARFIPKRPDPPFLIASTLMVPGYVDRKEVAHIARFIASLDPSIPYSLLAFHPQFLMSDLPATSRQHAYECLEAAQEAGLTRVKIGNIALLKA